MAQLIQGLAAKSSDLNPISWTQVLEKNNHTSCILAFRGALKHVPPTTTHASGEEMNVILKSLTMG